MEKLINFIDIIAWVSFTLSFILICARVYGFCTYSKLEEALDRFNGVKATFPVTIPGIIFITSVAWLAS